MELELLRKRAVPVSLKNVFLLENSEISILPDSDGRKIIVYGSLSWAGDFVLTIPVNENSDMERPKYCEGCMHFDNVDGGEFGCRISNGLRSIIINRQYNCSCPFFKVIEIT